MARYILTIYNNSCMSDSYWPLDPDMTLKQIKLFAENRVKPNAINSAKRGRRVIKADDEPEDYTLPANVDDTHTLTWKKFAYGYRLFYTRPLRETDHYDERDYEDDGEEDEDGNIIGPSGWERLNAQTYTSHEFTIWDTTKTRTR